MMKLMRVWALVLAMLMLVSWAAAEAAADAVIAVVNGEELLNSEYAAIEAQYLQMYADASYNVEDESLASYIKDIALTTAIQDKLVLQDMTAHDCFQFDAETEQWMIEQGNAAYQSALADMGEALRSELGYGADVDMAKYALTYANLIGVSEQDYIDVFRTQYAYMNYYDWLLRDHPVTEDEIQQAYGARVEASRALYENDAAAFETVMYNGDEVWYRPGGYRGVLSIMLPAEGDTNEERLVSVQQQVDEIDARLKAGEAFQVLVAEYDTAGDANDEALMAAGYQVHRDSVIWEDAFIDAAFSEEMDHPGCWSKPVVSEHGVHILYYLCDVEPGPIAMSNDIHDALAYTIYNERAQVALQARVQELSDSAVVELR